jgi:hypothetical protein
MRFHRLPVALLFLSASITADASEFVRANIYFVPWHVESFVAMRPEDVRKAAQQGEISSRVFRVTSVTRIAEVLRVLDLGALHPERTNYREDTRLVIHFFDRGERD